ncbi:MAG: DUF2141 domain-containing protein [Microscillaceae bacterium]
MQARHLTFALLLGLTFFLTASNFNKGPFQLRIKACQSDQGKVMLALYNSAASYMKIEKAFRKEMLTIKNGVARLNIQDLPYGEYAAVCFHDENENQKLDKNMMGIPKEGYGFSNNAKGSFGPPSFEKARFSHQSGQVQADIQMVYW